MESVRALYNEDCDFQNKMFLINEEADLWRNSEAVNVNANFTFFDENLYSSSEYFDPSFCFLQEHANISNASDNYSACFPNVSLQTSHFCDSDLVHVTNDISESMFFGAMDEPNNAPAQYLPNDHVMHDVLNMKAEVGLENITDLGNKRKFEVPRVVANVENPKKKCCVPRDIPKCKKNVQAKRNKSVNIDEEGTYNSSNGHSSSSNSSEDDSNASHERSILDSKGSEVLDSCKKPRAGRGAATDPQSLYARKRREKINERLRILQNLVPNGTKVDISTMLEEAVHYVNFLQLQIKLLSSDEKWMYAPIAYNGMNMGLY